MKPSPNHLRMVARLSNGAAVAVHTDILECLSDFLAKTWRLGFGNKMMLGMQSRKGIASGIGRSKRPLASLPKI